MHDDFSTTFPGLAIHDLLDAIPHGIAVVDRELRIVAVNSHIEALTGLSLAEVRGVYVDFVLRSSIGGRGRTFREVLDSGAAQVLDGDIVSRDRRKLPMQFTISPLRGQDGRSGQAIATVIAWAAQHPHMLGMRSQRLGQLGASATGALHQAGLGVPCQRRLL